MSGVAVGVTAAAAAGASIYSSRQQAKAQKSAADQQARASAAALNQQQQEFNKANQNQVDISGILQDNTGQGSATMLTGAGGVGRNNMQLGGGSSLLGG